MSEVFPINQFHNIGVIARVARVLAAKLLSFAIAYVMMSYSLIIQEYYFGLVMAPIVYLLFTGLLGWDPIEALDRRLKWQRSVGEIRSGFAENHVRYAVIVKDKI
ncbi:MAG: hypothetical protein AB1810_04580 [Pseudomonadota bacterium]